MTGKSSTRRLTMRVFLAMAGVALAAAPAARAQEHQHADQVGTVAFTVSCNAEAQTRMNQAVAMLHSFWFPEARKTFESVVQADPACGIAYWGVAMTHFGNPMAGGSTAPGQAAGWDAAEKAVGVGGKSDRDRAYIDAAVALFQDHATLNNRARMLKYEAAMKRIVDRFPDDTEAKIFHAIFRVANAPPTDMTFAQQKEAAAVLTRLYREQPRHPGLAHYIIHAFDSPPLANLALDAARQYAAIAPAAPHALHMPSHIFTRLGYWDESIKTNRRSADLEPTPGGKSHPMDYMVYAYLQQGRDAAALAVMKEIGGNTTGEYIAGALGSFNALAMPARYALERDDWKGAASLSVTSTARSAEAAVTHFAKGLGAARSGDVALAKQEVAALEAIVADLTAQKDPYWPVVIDAQKLAVSAWVAHAEGRHADALRLAREAADKEELVEKHPVTPGPLVPARELLADILMVHNQPAQALVAYETTLKREPNRTRTLVGAARAAKAAQKTDVAKKYYRLAIDVMDPKATRPELAEARAFVSQK
jgi:tetratricopeptide (TPR) repeat protein